MTVTPVLANMPATSSNGIQGFQKNGIMLIVPPTTSAAASLLIQPKRILPHPTASVPTDQRASPIEKESDERTNQE